MSTHSKIKDGVYQQAVEKGAATLYASWADQYNADNAALGFHLPQIAAGYAARHVVNKGARILDAGCGTGLVGITLKTLGYSNLTGVDISQNMLDHAQNLDAYTSLYQSPMGSGALPFKAQSFDALLCIGCMGPGHVPPAALDEFVQVCAPGSPIIFNVLTDIYKEQGFDQKMIDLSEQGVWEQREVSDPFRPYYIGEPDLFTTLFVFEVR